MTVRTEFTRRLQSFLMELGYTHIYNRSIAAGQNELEDTEDYYLIPLRADDPRLKYEETDMMIEAINTTDVLDMALGDEFITFYVEMPQVEFEHFLKSE